MKIFDVIRNGKCLECGQLSSKILGEFDAETPEEAIDKAQSSWIYDNYGEAGSLREEDIKKEDEFLQGDFVAEEIK
jgi:hypothetical protein